MAAPLSVVKVGGSLMRDRARLRAVLADLAEGRDGRAAVVPGGGPFADAVRAAQGAAGFGDRLAHRLALDAMGRTAEVFAALEPRLPIAPGRYAILPALAAATAAIWDPVCLRAGDSAIPENWDVTSDSLALWLAARLGAARCVLVKSAPCPAGTRPETLARLGLVDRAFPAYAAAYGGGIALRGPDDRDVPVRTEGRDAAASPRGDRATAGGSPRRRTPAPRHHGPGDAR